MTARASDEVAREITDFWRGFVRTEEAKNTANPWGVLEKKIAECVQAARLDGVRMGIEAALKLAKHRAKNSAYKQMRNAAAEIAFQLEYETKPESIVKSEGPTI